MDRTQQEMRSAVATFIHAQFGHVRLDGYTQINPGQTHERQQAVEGSVRIGLAINGTSKRADGRLFIDYISWDGAPDLTLKRPVGDCDFWRMAWVNGA
ncbi:MAG TPA: hypothetical protein PLR25_23810, partial [Planctomycetaceae bacterium]|nr:hypothetical protein [Planctomycetaceae bacterium]